MRVAVVTGASSGIGAALCRGARARGWHVVGLSRRSGAPDADEHEACDVADREAVEAVAARVLERHPRIDLLVNNAGIAGRRRSSTPTPERIEAVDPDELPRLGLVPARVPARARPRRRTSSTSSRSPGTVAVGPYSASKHAQLAFSRSVAVELRPRGIRVHTVNPGFVETPGFPQKRLLPKALDRVVIDPPDVARHVVGVLERNRRETASARVHRVALLSGAGARPAAWSAGRASGQ